MEENKNKNQAQEEKITRKEAIQKAGITALTAASLLFLETKKASADSISPTDPGGGRGTTASEAGETQTASEPAVQTYSEPEVSSTNRGKGKGR